MNIKIIWLSCICLFLISFSVFSQKYVIVNTGLKIEIENNIIEDTLLQQKIIMKNNTGKEIFSPDIVNSYIFLNTIYTNIGVVLHKPGGGINPGHHISCKKIGVGDTLEYSVELRIDSLHYPIPLTISNDFLFVGDLKNTVEKFENQYIIKSDYYIENYHYLIVEIPLN